MRYIIALLIVVALLSACYPVQTQEQVDARRAEQAVAVEPEPTAIALATAEAPQAPCEIKGNVSRSDKVYHLPGGVYYARVKVDFAQGDAWFCTEQEAEAAGFRRSMR